MKRASILLIILMVTTVGLAGCRGGNEPETGEVNGEAAVDTQVDQFLSERGITLGEGVERASLSGEEGSGVATREVSEGTTSYTVIADLPTPASGAYMAWLKNEAGEVVSLGALRYEKGGFMLERSSSEDRSQYNLVVVSQEKGAATEPTTLMLEGSF